MSKLSVIQQGHTNATYIKNNKFIVEKNINLFNHKIDYKVTQTFSFVPKLFKQTKDTLEWEIIKGNHLEKPNLEDLTQIATIFSKIHNSKIKLPKNNLRKRVQYYLKVLSEKHIFVPEINQHYRSMMKLLSAMQNNTPCHNDIWPQNLIKDKNNKIWLVDWEYATMGDIYFDLSYFTESSQLTQAETEYLIQHYQASTPNWTCNQVIWRKYELFTNWLILLWSYAQKDGPPFDLSDVKKRLNGK